MTLIKNKVTKKWKKVCEDYAYSWGFAGMVVPFAGTANKVPPHWLPCDGSEYNASEYPNLFEVIGYKYGGSGSKFKVPDYRECTLVGAGENGTDTMEAHDVYDLGEFKDDQLQNHQHQNYGSDYGSAAVAQVRVPKSDGGGIVPYNWTVTAGRRGLVTRGKRKGTNYIIHV